jgi:hypothetical protein
MCAWSPASWPRFCPLARAPSLVFNDPARLPKERRVRVSARGLDAELRAETMPAQVKREWLDPLLEAASGKRALGRAPNQHGHRHPASARAGQQPSDGVVHGRMDPTVLRNALVAGLHAAGAGLLPVARWPRRATPTLRGRMKLELSIERGELHDAVVRSSTLGQS